MSVEDIIKYLHGEKQREASPVVSHNDTDFHHEISITITHPIIFQSSQL